MITLFCPACGEFSNVDNPIDAIAANATYLVKCNKCETAFIVKLELRETDANEGDV